MPAEATLAGTCSPCAAVGGVEAASGRVRVCDLLCPTARWAAGPSTPGSGLRYSSGDAVGTDMKIGAVGNHCGVHHLSSCLCRGAQMLGQILGH